MANFNYSKLTLNPANATVTFLNTGNTVSVVDGEFEDMFDGNVLGTGPIFQHNG